MAAQNELPPHEQTYLAEKLDRYARSFVVTEMREYIPDDAIDVLADDDATGSFLGLVYLASTLWPDEYFIDPLTVMTSPSSALVGEEVVA